MDIEKEIHGRIFGNPSFVYTEKRGKGEPLDDSYIAEILSEYNEIMENEEFSNVDILSDVGDLLNDYNITTGEMKTLISKCGTKYSSFFLQILYDEELVIKEKEISEIEQVKSILLKHGVTNITDVSIREVINHIKK